MRQANQDMTYGQVYGDLGMIHFLKSYMIFTIPLKIEGVGSLQLKKKRKGEEKAPEEI